MRNGTSLEFLIAAGASKEEIEKLLKAERHEKEITECYETEMGYNPLPWGKLDHLKKFLLRKTTDEIETFAKWCKRPYSAFGPEKARLYPDMVIDLWPLAFATAKKQKVGADVEDAVAAFMGK